MHVTRPWETTPSSSDCETCHVNVARQLRRAEGALGTHRLRVFADLFLGDHLYSHFELRSDGGSDAVDGSPRSEVKQAYVRLASGSWAAGVQAGRFATPFGAYPTWHLSTVDYFLGPPLPYEYRTVMNRQRVPMDAQDFLYWKDAPEDVDRPGAPPVWDVPYQWGAMVFGRLGPVDLRAAAMNSAPSSGPKSWRFEWNRFERPSWVVGARMRPSASLEIGIAYNRGPWMEDIIGGTIQPPPGSPPGTEAPGRREFDQELFSADISFERGPTMVRVEALVDRWRVPNVVGMPMDVSISLEVQRDLAAGFFAAVRGGLIDFRAIDDGLGGASPLPDGTADWGTTTCTATKGPWGIEWRGTPGCCCLPTSKFRPRRTTGTSDSSGSVFGGRSSRSPRRETSAVERPSSRCWVTSHPPPYPSPTHQRRKSLSYKAEPVGLSCGRLRRSSLVSAVDSRIAPRVTRSAPRLEPTSPLGRRFSRPN